VIRVKICGVSRPRDAVVAEEAGASYLGAVLVAGSPRRVEPPTARRVADAVSIPLVVVVADSDVEEVAAAADRSGAGVIQLHGSEGPAEFSRLREMGSWELWKGVRVRSRGDIEEALALWGSVADLLLLDAWDPRRLGGTGVPFPWEALESVREDFPPSGARLGVAGGLDADNVGEAIRRLRPHLVDASSSLEARPGVKDPERIRSFLAAAVEPGAGPGAGPGVPAPPETSPARDPRR